MAPTHSPADDIVYNLVSVQYHALKATQAYDAYIEDAAGHDDVQSFFRQCAEQSAERAVKCHELLGKITGGGGSVHPPDDQRLTVAGTHGGFWSGDFPQKIRCTGTLRKPRRSCSQTRAARWGPNSGSAPQVPPSCPSC